MRIGKHDWRMIVRPSDYSSRNVTEYQWRPANLHGLPDELHARREPWRSGEEWPGYNFNDSYLGLPKTLRALYDREKPQLDRHLYGIEPPPDPQIGFDFSAPASSTQDDAASLARFHRSAPMSDKPTQGDRQKTGASPAPWHYEISANAPDSWEIRTADGRTVAEVPRWKDRHGNDTPEAETNVALLASAPQLQADNGRLRDALKLAQQALNTAPRFRVGETDSYKIASIVDKALAAADPVRPATEADPASRARFQKPDPSRSAKR